MKASDIILALRNLYRPPEWITAEEFQYEPGFRGGQRRLDFLAFNSWPSKKHEIHGMEVKVSRNDFLMEKANPDKRKRAVELCDYFFFVTPEGIIKKGELPPDCGWILVDPFKAVAEIKTWPTANKPPIELFPRSFLAGLARNWNDRYDAHDIRQEIRSAKKDLLVELRRIRS